MELITRYEIARKRICQGWAFTIRREAYFPIPDDLRVFGGDDYLFTNLYLKGWQVAVALSSPIIHYHARSRRYFDGDRNEEARRLGKYVDRKLTYYGEYSRREPESVGVIDGE